MGLFSSKSSSSTTSNYNDNSVNSEMAVGNDARDNLLLGNNAAFTYTEGGLTGENLENVLNASRDFLASSLSANADVSNKALETSQNVYTQAQDTLGSVFNKMVGAVQGSAETAIIRTGEAYAESKNEVRSTIDGIKPLARYAMIAAIFYFIFYKRK